MLMQTELSERAIKMHYWMRIHHYQIVKNAPRRRQIEDDSKRKSEARRGLELGTVAVAVNEEAEILLSEEVRHQKVMKGV